MNFTYKWYEHLLNRLIEEGYHFSNYRDWVKYDKTVILRHDIDVSLGHAVKMADLERKVLGKKNNSVYFVLLSTNFYNIFSRESKQYIDQIFESGGSIGLHFDETQYDIKDSVELEKNILKEINILENLVEKEIDAVSMHRPSQSRISSQLVIGNKVNAYGKEFFDNMKYLSDSRRNWKENVNNIISDKRFNRLHILTHPIWYDQIEKEGIKQAVYDEIISSIDRKYEDFKKNISDFESVISEKDFNEFLKYILDR